MTPKRYLVQMKHRNAAKNAQWTYLAKSGYETKDRALGYALTKADAKAELARLERQKPMLKFRLGEEAL